MCKRIVALMLVGVLSISCLVGCGKDTEAVSNSVDVKESTDSDDEIIVNENADSSKIIVDDSKVKDKKFIAALDAYQEYFDTAIKADYNYRAANIALDADGMPIMVVVGAATQEQENIDCMIFSYIDDKVKLVTKTIALSGSYFSGLKVFTDGLVRISEPSYSHMGSDFDSHTFYRLQGDELTFLYSARAHYQEDGYSYKLFLQFEEDGKEYEEFFVRNTEEYFSEIMLSRYEEEIKKVFGKAYNTDEIVWNNYIKELVAKSMFVPEIYSSHKSDFLISPIISRADMNGYLEPTYFRQKIEELKEAKAMNQNDYFVWSVNYVWKYDCVWNSDLDAFFFELESIPARDYRIFNQLSWEDFSKTSDMVDRFARVPSEGSNVYVPPYDDVTGYISYITATIMFGYVTKGGDLDTLDKVDNLAELPREMCLEALSDLDWDRRKLLEQKGLISQRFNTETLEGSTTKELVQSYMDYVSSNQEYEIDESYDYPYGYDPINWVPETPDYSISVEESNFGDFVSCVIDGYDLGIGFTDDYYASHNEEKQITDGVVVGYEYLESESSFSDGVAMFNITFEDGTVAVYRFDVEYADVEYDDVDGTVKKISDIVITKVG